MNRSRAFNNYLEKNIKNKLFSQSYYLNRKEKRHLEDILTFLKKEFYDEYGIIPRAAISLTGPAGKAHAKNFKSINIEHVYVPEYSNPTYKNLVHSINNSEYKDYMTIRNVEFFDFFEQLTNGNVMLSDIDFDTTCTLDSISSELTKFAYTLSNKLSNLTPVFTFTVTLSRRRTGGHTKEDLEQVFVKTLNSLNKIRIIDMYLQPYFDTSAMLTAFFVLGRESFVSVVNPSCKSDATTFKYLYPVQHRIDKMGQ